MKLVEIEEDNLCPRCKERLFFSNDATQKRS
jgi:hypothetical protein